MRPAIAALGSRLPCFRSRVRQRLTLAASPQIARQPCRPEMPPAIQARTFAKVHRQRFRHARRPPGEQLESSRVRFRSAHQAQLIAAAFFGSTRDDRCELDQRVLPLLVLGAAMIASSHPDNFRKRGITTKQTVHSRGDGKGPLSAAVRGVGSQSTRA